MSWSSIYTVLKSRKSIPKDFYFVSIIDTLCWTTDSLDLVVIFLICQNTGGDQTI